MSVAAAPLHEVADLHVKALTTKCPLIVGTVLLTALLVVFDLIADLLYLFLERRVE